MEYEHLIYTKEEGIATMTLNRPQKFNAFNMGMYLGILHIINDAANDETVRVLVITGTGRAFCVGADVKSLEQGFTERTVTAADASSDLLPTFLLQRMNKPAIAALNGIVAGGGFDIACACDIRIASEKATFSTIFVRRGLLPTLGGAYFLPRIVGIDKACELIWTGDLIDAREAQRIGLVTKVVPHEELEADTKELAVKLAKGPPLAIAKSKQAIYKGLNMELEPALQDLMQDVAVLSQTEDHREALTAFLEKREPIFKGR
jgi:2-(1,2-epoxy-1,2-dihydrophenyl)acetyl-CoA isomerase